MLNTPRVKAIISFIEKLTVPSGKGEGKTFKMRPFQRRFIRDIYGPVDKDSKRIVRRAIKSIARKNGKGLALDTPIPTPDGWTTMGNISQGDVLYDESGKECNVIFASDVRLLDCYEITFSNDEKIICDGDHLWLTTAKVNMVGIIKGRTCRRMKGPSISINRGYVSANLCKGPIYIGRTDNPESHKIAERMMAEDIINYPIGVDNITRVRDTRELFKTQRYSKRNNTNHSINMPFPIYGSSKELPVDPYILGAWLGDGDSANAAISCGKEDLDEIVNNLKNHGADIIIRKNKTCYRISLTLGRCGKRADKLITKLREIDVIQNKHIPDIYLRASIGQRMDLLHGLMDTDGTCDRQGRAQEICTVRKPLADGICELLASFGIKYSVREKPLRCNGKSVFGIGYYIQFCCLRDILPVFTLPRKLSRQKLWSNRNINSRSRTIQIVSIEKVKSIPTKCIQVDSPNKLFLCGRTMLPTHNTAEIACLVLVHLVGPEAIINGEIYSAATTQKQAALVFKYASQIVRADPELGSYIKIVESTKTMVCFSNGSKYHAIAAEAGPAYGLNPSLVVYDELAQAKNRDLYDALETSQATREEPLFITISTQSNDPQHILSILIDDGLRGHDPTTICHLYAVPDDAENIFTDQKLWRLANPALGDFRSLSEMKTAAKRAVRMPTFEAAFRNLYLNQRVNAESPLIPRAEWLACKGDATIELGSEVYLGLDLSGKTDLTALVAVSAGDFDKIRAWFWKPQETMIDHEKRDRVPYTVWKSQGFIETTPGRAIDYEWVAERLRQIVKDYVVVGMAFDSYRMDDLRSALNKIGIESWVDGMVDKRKPPPPGSDSPREGALRTVRWGQGYASMTQAVEALEVSILERKFIHDGNPCLTWNFSNAISISDAAGNRKLDKSKTRFRIDGAVAAAMAIGLKSKDMKQIPGPSVYDGLSTEDLSKRMAF